jgi:hypothetical protein
VRVWAKTLIFPPHSVQEKRKKRRVVRQSQRNPFAGAFFNLHCSSSSILSRRYHRPSLALSLFCVRMSNRTLHTHTHTHTQVDSYRYRKTTQKNPKQRKKWIPPYTGDALRSAQHSLRRCSTTGHSSDLRFSLSFPTSSPLLLCVIESPAFPAFVVHELVGGLSPQAFAGVYMHIFPSSLYQQVHCRETAT